MTYTQKVIVWHVVGNIIGYKLNVAIDNKLDKVVDPGFATRAFHKAVKKGRSRRGVIYQALSSVAAILMAASTEYCEPASSWAKSEAHEIGQYDLLKGSN